MDNLLKLFGASEASLPIARDYFRIILIFIPVYMMANGMNAIIRADGSPGISTFITQKSNVLYDLYLTTTPVRNVIEAQDKVIKKIASKGSCVIVGRAADYVLRNNKNLVRIFIYAPEDYRIKSVIIC